LNEITERCLTDERKDHLVDHAGRVIEAGLRQAIEHAGFPMHVLEVFDEGFFTLPFRFGAQAVDEFQQQIHQDIREFSPAEQTEGRQEGHSERHGRPAELMGFFDRNPLAIRVEHAGGRSSNRSGGGSPDRSSLASSARGCPTSRAQGPPEFLSRARSKGAAESASETGGSTGPHKASSAP
jgi:hypothetical protein